MKGVFMKQMKKVVAGVLALSLCVGGFTACSDFLDVVPDGVATMDNAFSNRINAEKFLFTCYNRLPNQNAEWNYPGNTGMDEIWWDMDVTNTSFSNQSGPRIATGSQNITNPYQDYWDGKNGGKKLWEGIRDCNIFLENIDRVPDMEESERGRWISEVKFIKAYLHFFLMELYGPIPIVDVNLDVNASPEEVRVKRRPVDEVVEYFDDNGYTRDAAERAYAYYTERNWVDSKGSQVKNWKSKCIAVWFKPENRKPESPETDRPCGYKIPV